MINVQEGKVNAKLSAETAIEIYAIMMLQKSLGKDHQCSGFRSKTSAAALARRFSITEKTVRDIWCGRTWRRETAALLDADEASKVLSGMRPPGRPKKSHVTPDTRHHPASVSTQENSCDVSGAECSCANPHVETGGFIGLRHCELDSEDGFPDVPHLRSDTESGHDSDISFSSTEPKETVSELPNFDTRYFPFQNAYSVDSDLANRFEFQHLAIPLANPVDDPFHHDWPYWMPAVQNP